MTVSSVTAEDRVVLDAYGVPADRVVITAPPPSEGTLRAAFASGARAVLLTDPPRATVQAAARTLAADERYVDPRFLPAMFEMISPRSLPAGDHGLTTAQVRVLQLLPRGLTTAEVAEQLGLSPNTVKSHVRQICRRLDARDRAHAVALAQRRGLLDPDDGRT